jgi:hypothetical protein
MKTTPLRSAVTLRFGPTLSLREAIGLPEQIAAVDSGRPLVLDLRAVRQTRASALAALIPALASLHRKVTILGLEHLPGWAELPMAAAA